MVRVESSQGLALVGGVFLSTEIRAGIGKVFPQPLHFQMLLHFLRLHPKEFLLEACILSNRYLKTRKKKREDGLAKLKTLETCLCMFVLLVSWLQ